MRHHFEFSEAYTVDPKSGCWNWHKFRDPSGYGRYGRCSLAHRVSYELHRGPVPFGLTLDHLCRNRACVNPDHLEAVTNAENIRRGDCGRHNSDKTHCPQGHPLSGDNLYEYPDGRRACRICARATKLANKKKAGKVPMAQRTHCPQGHAYTEENTYINPSGQRVCRTCRAARARKK